MKTGNLKQIKWGLIAVLTSVGILLLISLFVVVDILSTAEEKELIFAVLYTVVLLILIAGWIRTKQFIFIPAMFLNLASLFLLLTPQPWKYGVLLLHLSLIMITMTIYLRQYKYYIRHRRILELAAAPVNEAANGFTSRPFPVENKSFNIDELDQFSDFVRENGIAVPVFDGSNFIFSLPEDWINRKCNIRGSYSEDTRVMFNLHGMVTSIIKRKDYQQFSEKLTFDQLCASLGDLFVEFFELHRIGDNGLILNKINRTD